jgi:hypothetical protein
MYYLEIKLKFKRIYHLNETKIFDKSKLKEQRIDHLN